MAKGKDSFAIEGDVIRAAEKAGYKAVATPLGNGTWVWGLYSAAGQTDEEARQLWQQFKAERRAQASPEPGAPKRVGGRPRKKEA